MTDDRESRPVPAAAYGPDRLPRPGTVVLVAGHGTRRFEVIEVNWNAGQGRHEAQVRPEQPHPGDGTELYGYQPIDQLRD